MSSLTIFQDSSPDTPLSRTTDHAVMAAELKKAGIRFEQWELTSPLAADASPEQIIAAYKPQIDTLCNEEGYGSYDVVTMNPSHPQKEEFRKKFKSEHTHTEDEVRFFVRGQGLFTMHIEDKVFEVVCESGDFISVPEGTPHWFDMGPEPEFSCIRLFDNTEGWIAHYTGADIAEKFSELAPRSAA